MPKNVMAILACMVVMTTCARAEFSLADVSLGEYWFGDEYSLEQMEGRVVLLEKWGKN